MISRTDLAEISRDILDNLIDLEDEITKMKVTKRRLHSALAELDIMISIDEEEEENNG